MEPLVEAGDKEIDWNGDAGVADEKDRREKQFRDAVAKTKKAMAESGEKDRLEALRKSVADRQLSQINEKPTINKGGGLWGKLKGIIGIGGKESDLFK